MIAPSDIRTEDLAEASRVAAESVFTMMLGLEPTPLAAYEEADARPYDGVVALVSFTGDWVGVGMFCCHENLACRIGAAMLGHEIDRIDADVLDGIGEMANMVIGNLKEQLEPRTGPLGLSIPTVVYGKNFATRAGVRAPWTIQPFRLDGFVLEVRACIKAV